VPNDEFDVVVICSGNRFRSPIAEAVLRGETDGLPVRVRSFGTLDLASSQALPEALELAPSLGLDLTSHRSHRLAGEDLSDADLVIGFEPIHVSSAVVGAKARRERTFLLTELVERLDGVIPSEGLDPVERARAAVREADEARSATPSTPEEIADPIGGTRAAFRASGDQIYRLTRRLAEQLFG
jgi:low molecular weight protein-tyrosine phosphatase